MRFLALANWDCWRANAPALGAYHRNYSRSVFRIRRGHRTATERRTEFPAPICLRRSARANSDSRRRGRQSRRTRPSLGAPGRREVYRRLYRAADPPLPTPKGSSKCRKWREGREQSNLIFAWNAFEETFGEQCPQTRERREKRPGTVKNLLRVFVDHAAPRGRPGRSAQGHCTAQEFMFNAFAWSLDP